MSMQIPSNFDPLNSNGNHMSCFSQLICWFLVFFSSYCFLFCNNLTTSSINKSKSFKNAAILFCRQTNHFFTLPLQYFKSASSVSTIDKSRRLQDQFTNQYNTIPRIFFRPVCLLNATVNPIELCLLTVTIYLCDSPH